MAHACSKRPPTRRPTSPLESAPTQSAQASARHALPTACRVRYPPRGRQHTRHSTRRKTRRRECQLVRGDTHTHTHTHTHIQTTYRRQTYTHRHSERGTQDVAGTGLQESCVCVCLCVCVCVCVCVQVKRSPAPTRLGWLDSQPTRTITYQRCTHTHTHTHTHTQTHTQTHTHTSLYNWVYMFRLGTVHTQGPCPDRQSHFCCTLCCTHVRTHEAGCVLEPAVLHTHTHTGAGSAPSFCVMYCECVACISLHAVLCVHLLHTQELGLRPVTCTVGRSCEPGVPCVPLVHTQELGLRPVTMEAHIEPYPFSGTTEFKDQYTHKEGYPVMPPLTGRHTHAHTHTRLRHACLVGQRHRHTHTHTHTHTRARARACTVKRPVNASMSTVIHVCVCGVWCVCVCVCVCRVGTITRAGLQLPLPRRSLGVEFYHRGQTNQYYVLIPRTTAVPCRAKQVCVCMCASRIHMQAPAARVRGLALCLFVCLFVLFLHSIHRALLCLLRQHFVVLAVSMPRQQAYALMSVRCWASCCTPALVILTGVHHCSRQPAAGICSHPIRFPAPCYACLVIVFAGVHHCS